MLVLSRKPGQELVIDGNIRITVNRVSGNRVALGISAPDDVRIVRGELEPLVASFEKDESTTPKLHRPDGPVPTPWVSQDDGLNPMTRQLH